MDINLYFHSFQQTTDVQWTNSEICALIEYIALYHAPSEDGTSVWPVHKRQDFWENCADAIVQRSGTCRRSCKSLSKINMYYNLCVAASACVQYHMKGIIQNGVKVKFH